VEIVDAQLHVWERSHADRPWVESNRLPAGAEQAAQHAQPLPEMTIDGTLAAMDEAGVDAAVIFTPALYGFDNRYSLEAAARDSDRFAVAGNLDPTAPDIEEQIRTWRTQPGALAIRMPLFRPEGRARWQAGLYDPFLAAAQRYDVPVATYPPYLLRELVPTIEAFPDLRLVIDHLGLPQPTPFSATERDPFARLPDLLALARYPNVAVKLSAAPTLSREPFPFRDLWPPLHQILDAFGPDRLMWGSDWTRVVHFLTYREGLAFITETSELSPADKEQILGATLRKILRWPKPAPETRT
jgi:predicted TIM-barrel fold metal-dependent hydrolase